MIDFEVYKIIKQLKLIEDKNKKYCTNDNRTGVVYVFNDIDEFISYFTSNGVTVNDEILKLCTLKKTSNNKYIALKRICDYFISKRKENDSLLEYYLEKLGKNNLPDFIKKYLEVPSLQRLKYIGYFCGMDYASKNIYEFKEKISRYDHSLSVALLTYNLTRDKKATLAALFHDISTPCFSHVIDYMNKDYEKQESTEEHTEYIIKRDKELNRLLKEDNIELDDIINFKQYPIVDSSRPKLCADRIDGIILTGISWTKRINEEDIDEILNSLTIYTNEDNEPEIGFNNEEIASKVLKISNEINEYCHSNEDNYMMELLANITRTAISQKYISYIDLFTLSEEDIFALLTHIKDESIKEQVNRFKNITKEEIPVINIDNIKKREINPLVGGKRYMDISITKNYK